MIECFDPALNWRVPTRSDEMLGSVKCVLPSKISPRLSCLLLQDNLLLFAGREFLDRRGESTACEECLVYASWSISFKVVLMKLVFHPQEHAKTWCRGSNDIVMHSDLTPYVWLDI